MIELKTKDGKIIKLPLEADDFNMFKPIEIIYKNKKGKTLIYTLRETKKSGLVLC